MKMKKKRMKHKMDSHLCCESHGASASQPVFSGRIRHILMVAFKDVPGVVLNGVAAGLAETRILWREGLCSLFTGLCVSVYERGSV